MTVINLFTFIGLILTFTYIIGLFTFLIDYEENRCEMTYMFEYPQYVQISMKVEPKFYKYGLYVYSEGTSTERARDMLFDGIPVLFIPGNAGSHKQVRSLASVALRSSLDWRPGYHFDYFALDLNEEFNGLYGGVLENQLEFANKSVFRILKLYKNTRNPPKSVIIVGHSMGGVIARALASSLNSQSNLIPLIITLATPHRRSPAILDYYTYSFYKKFKNISKLPSNTTIINLAGGYSDFLVPSYLTKLENGLEIVTTAVPLTWLSVDHLCILWCKQLVLAINRALFDSVNLKSKQISTEPEHRDFVFRHHLIKNSGARTRSAQRYLDSTNIDNRGEWIESLYRQYSVQLLNGTRQAQWYMVRYSELLHHEFLTLLTINLEVVDWVFACPAIYTRGHSRICYDGIHLTHQARIAPSRLYKRKILEVNMHKLKESYENFTHVVIRVLPTDEPKNSNNSTVQPGKRSGAVEGRPSTAPDLLPGPSIAQDPSPGPSSAQKTLPGPPTTKRGRLK